MRSLPPRRCSSHPQPGPAERRARTLLPPSWPYTLKRSVHGSSRYGKHLRQVCNRILARIIHAPERAGLLGGKLRLLAAQLAPGAGDGHALAGTRADLLRTPRQMTETLIGYARCSTDRQAPSQGRKKAGRHLHPEAWAMARRAEEIKRRIPPVPPPRRDNPPTAATAGCALAYSPSRGE